MSEERREDPQSVWKNQPGEKLEMNLHHFVERRTQELYSSTRSEILGSIVAAIFLIAVVTWRFHLAQRGFQQLGLGLVIVWVLVSGYWFRDRIWKRAPPPQEGLGSPGLAYYRRELERRRDHLRNAWVWLGPVLLACLVLVATLAGVASASGRQLMNVAPFLILLVAWIGIGFLSRRRQAARIQQEIDEIET